MAARGSRQSTAETGGLFRTASLYEFLQTVETSRDATERRSRTKQVNTDSLGWTIARLEGKSVSAVLSERIWRKLGAEQDAFFTVDSVGTPFAGGGLNTGLRDLARFGEMLRNDGMFNGQRSCRKRLSMIFAAVVTEKPLPKLDTTCFRAGATGTCGG